jgi:hypothetical protein
MPVGPDVDRGASYAMHAMEVGSRLASGPIDFTLALDPKIDRPDVRQNFESRFPGRVRFVSVPESGLVRSSNSCGFVHGEMLQALVASAETELFCVVDADTAFLRKDWDIYLEEQMDVAPRAGRESRVVVGSESPLDDKYREFPTSMFFTIRTREFMSLGVQMNKNKTTIERWPGFGKEDGGKGWVRVTAETEHLYCRPPGTRLYLDTGFEMLPAVRSSPYDWHALRAVKFGEHEWYVTDDDEPLLTHMTGSYVRPWRSKISEEWRKKVERAVVGERPWEPEIKQP